jgi:hypothetical protein
MTGPFLLGTDVGSGGLFRGEVLGAAEDGRTVVTREGTDPAEVWNCEIMESADGSRLSLAAGDAVIVCGVSSQHSGVILGRIGASRREPDELVIEAGKILVLKCGDGSITIRADGKILIKGKDLVSHAQRVNRIKGGSVAIN